MPRKKTVMGSPADGAANRPISLKQLAAHLGLSPTTLSLVLNSSPGAGAIPQETKKRIFAAAEEFNYRPNPIARSLRSQRTFTVGVLVPELSDGYSALVLGGVEDYLLQSGYFYFVASHRHKDDLIGEYARLFGERQVEGMVLVDTPLPSALHVPVVNVSGHDDVDGVTNIVLNHDRAADLALEYLVGLGHRNIAIIKGQSFSADTDVRWRAIQAASARLGIPVDPALVAQLEGDDPSPEPGYIAAQKLLASGKPFTALFSFNDISAIGAIRTLREAGLRVPEDVSVIGFDDALGAAYHNPALTTIRQPLRQMGRLAAECVLERISRGPRSAYPREVTVEPEMIIRQSTARVADTAAQTARLRTPK